MASTNKIPKREIRIFYKTDNMLFPQLKYKIDKERNEVACMASFVPTFEPVMPQDVVMTTEVPLGVELCQGKDFCFIFLVDCSGSMSGARMKTTNEALKLFIQSLPIGCDFSILRFGSHSQYMGQQIWTYSD